MPTYHMDHLAILKLQFSDSILERKCNDTELNVQGSQRLSIERVMTLERMPEVHKTGVVKLT